MTAPRRGRRAARLVIRHSRRNTGLHDRVSKFWWVWFDGKEVGFIERDHDRFGMERPVKLHIWNVPDVNAPRVFCESVAVAKRRAREYFAVR